MVDGAKIPTIEEVLERIVQLENQAVGMVEQLAKASADFQRAAKIFADFDKLLMHHCKSHDDEFTDAWARIKSLEFTIFPNLARDIVELNNIVGASGPDKENQLDSREKLPWNDNNNPSNPV